MTAPRISRAEALRPPGAWFRLASAHEGASRFAAHSLVAEKERATVEQHWYLKQCRLLERLPPADLKQLEARCISRKFAQGDVIYLPADRGDAVLALISGRVKLCHVTRDGRESILALIEPGEIFGELCLIDSGEREELAKAASPCVIVLIPRDELQQLMQRFADLAQGITKLVGLRRIRIERRLRSLLFRPVRERLLQLLVELAADHGIRTPRGIDIRLKLSHQDLASIIGSTRESVSAALGEFQNQGLVVLGRQCVTICSIERLTAQAELHS